MIALAGFALGLLVGVVLLAWQSAPANPAPAWQAQGKMLCARDEKLYFGALTTRGKMVCLCGSPRLTAESGYLQYRFGRPGRIELEYPTERAGSQRMFFYAHYSRFQFETVSVRFKNGEYNYTIFYVYDGETGRPSTEYGLIVYGDREKGTSIPLRRSTVIGSLHQLEDALPCDPNNALADCP